MAWLEKWVERIVAAYDVPMRAQDTPFGWQSGEHDLMSHMYRFR